MSIDAVDGLTTAVYLVLRLEGDAMNLIALFHRPDLPMPSCPDVLDVLAEIRDTLNAWERDACERKITSAADYWERRIDGRAAGIPEGGLTTGDSVVE